MSRKRLDVETFDDNDNDEGGDRKGRGKSDNKRQRKKSASPASRAIATTTAAMTMPALATIGTISTAKDAPIKKAATAILVAINILAGPLAIRRDVDEDLSWYKGADPGLVSISAITVTELGAIA